MAASDRAWDAVVIGSGINGLVAAAMLAKAGRRVLVVERADHVGGCMVTDEITLPGFRHDVMAATFVLFVTGPAFAALGADLARHGLEFCHTPHPTAVLRPGGQALVLSTDRAANVAALDARHAGDGARHARDVGGVEADAPFLFALLGQPLWSRGVVRLLARQAWRRGLRGLKAWFGQALEPARGWLEAGYGADAQALWAPWPLHAGLTPEASYGGQMGRVIAFALEAAGAPVVKGGAGAAAQAFRRLIEAHGGAVRTSTDAARILVERGRAKGIETAAGEAIPARHVIASVAPGQLFDRLLPEELRPEGAGSFRHGRANFQLHYALDAAPEWIAEGPKGMLADVALIHLADGIDAVSRASNEAERGLLPAAPTLCVGQPAALDPSRCPPGKAVLWIQVPDAPRGLKGDAAGAIETAGAWTEAVREAFADRIEGILRRHIANFDAVRLARRAYSPADLEAMNANLVGGDPYGGATTLDQFFVWRPLKGSVDAATGLRGLHHIGASTHPGPGLGGGSGYNVARSLGA